MVTQQEIDRINALARKSKTAEGLTDDERKEQQALRAKYVASVRENLEAQLKNTVIVEPDGTKHKVTRKK